MKLKLIIHAWLDHIQRRVDLAQSTRRTYGRATRPAVRWASGARHSDLDWAEYVQHRHDRGTAVRTIALELRVLGIALRWAEKNGLVVQGTPARLPALRLRRAPYVTNRRTPSQRR